MHRSTFNHSSLANASLTSALNLSAHPINSITTPNFGLQQATTCPVTTYDKTKHHPQPITPFKN